MIHIKYHEHLPNLIQTYYYIVAKYYSLYYEKINKCECTVIYLFFFLLATEGDYLYIFNYFTPFNGDKAYILFMFLINFASVILFAFIHRNVLRVITKARIIILILVHFFSVPVILLI